jgi:hypothetical protein
MGFEPNGSVDVLKLATPPLNVAVPNTVVPFMNLTVPVGMPTAAATVAVKVTDCPCFEGFNDEVRVVVLAILLTFWLRFGEVLVAKFVSPL